MPAGWSLLRKPPLTWTASAFASLVLVWAFGENRLMKALAARGAAKQAQPE